MVVLALRLDSKKRNFVCVPSADINSRQQGGHDDSKAGPKSIMESAWDSKTNTQHTHEKCKNHIAGRADIIKGISLGGVLVLADY